MATNPNNEARVALVIGAGDATGGAIARRFAAGGYTACVTRREADKLAPLLQSIRDAGGQAHGFGSDARKEDEVIALVELRRDGSARVRINDLVYRLQLHSSQVEVVLMHGAVQIDEFTVPYAWVGRSLQFTDDERNVRYEVRFARKISNDQQQSR